MRQKERPKTQAVTLPVATPPQLPKSRNRLDLGDTFKMAMTTLVSNKLRSSLTMLGIMIGNASVIAMVGIGQGAQKLASSQFESLGPNVLFVVPGSQATRNTTFNIPKTLIWEDAKAIDAQVPSIQEVAAQINSRQLMTYRNRNTTNLVIGTTPEFLTVRSFDVEQGRFITELDLKRNNKVVALGPELAKRFFDIT